jgi:hypothetical protein
VDRLSDDGEGVTLGALLRDPADRTLRLHAVPLLLLRDAERLAGPADDVRLQTGDRLLLAGRLRDQRLLESVLTDRSTASYVLEGRFVPAGWIWRRFSSGRRSRSAVRSG